MGTLGMIGLGKMGGNMAERLRRGGHTVVGYDRSEDSGATSARSRSWCSSCRPPASCG
jgi:3-hydroxyisobutyrate dehydrogenase-like beta-hydroxyacid dehydrogenase